MFFTGGLGILAVGPERLQSALALVPGWQGWVRVGTEPALCPGSEAAGVSVHPAYCSSPVAIVAAELSGSWAGEGCRCRGHRAELARAFCCCCLQILRLFFSDSPELQAPTAKTVNIDLGWLHAMCEATSAPA